MRCGKPVEVDEQEYCKSCTKYLPAFEGGRSLWIHTQPVSSAIYRFKYQNKRRYGKVFGEEMAMRYGNLLRQWGIEEIIPVPLHKDRKKRRGFNQADILADELGRILNIPVNKTKLYRIRKTRPQKNLDYGQRIRNMKNAFAVSKDGRIKYSVLIVDDIYTTGSTIHKAAKMLKLSGVEKVYFLTISIGQGV
jgi:ComF family protein